MMIIGCDFHPRYQQIAMMDTETGDLVERRLEHENGEAREFYARLPKTVRVGMEATGYAQWFERMLAEQGHELWIGHASEIRAGVVPHFSRRAKDGAFDFFNTKTAHCFDPKDTHLIHLNHPTLCLRKGGGAQCLTLSPGNRSDNQKRFRPRCDGVRQRYIRLFVGPVFRTGEETQERAALLRDVIADRAAQNRISGFERVEDRAYCHPALHVDLHFAADSRQRPQMRGKLDADRCGRHGNVWTSTETTAGRSRTIGAQESPASEDA